MNTNKKKFFFLLPLVAQLFLRCVAAPFVLFPPSQVALAAEVSQAEALSIIGNGELIVEFHYFSDQIVGDDEVPRLRLYSDGTSLVFFPPYMTKAGYYVEVLDSVQMSDLISRIDDANLPSFNEEAVGADVAFSEQSLRMASGLVTYKSHAMISRVTVFSSVVGLGAQRVRLEDPITIEWADLHDHNAQFGRDIPAISALGGLVEHLELLVERAVGDPVLGD